MTLTQAGSTEAKRRIKFFVNTLFMDRPTPQRAVQQPSWGTLTPYYNEEVILPLSQLKQSTEVSVLYEILFHVLEILFHVLLMVIV
jgi:callose synthase